MAKDEVSRDKDLLLAEKDRSIEHWRKTHLKLGNDYDFVRGVPHARGVFERFESEVAVINASAFRGGREFPKPMHSDRQKLWYVAFVLRSELNGHIGEAVEEIAKSLHRECMKGDMLE